jgi:nitroreductase
MGLSSSREEQEEINDIFHVTDTFANHTKWRNIIRECIRSPPSSTNEFDTVEIGSSPYVIYVIRQLEHKQKIRELAYDQPQLTLGEIILVFCSRSDFVLNVENLVDESFEKKSIRQFMNQFWNPYHIDKSAWGTHQTYMAVGYVAAACSHENISCSIIDGFHDVKLKTFLDLPSFIEPISMLVIGSPD